METKEITLHDVEGIARKSGTDQHGCTWIEFEVDYLAEQLPGTCAICGLELESGWLCGDDSSEICDDHVTFAEDCS